MLLMVFMTQVIKSVKQVTQIHNPNSSQVIILKYIHFFPFNNENKALQKKILLKVFYLQ